MNDLKKFLPLPVLALLILAACTNPLAKEAPEKVMDSDVATQSASVEEAALPEMPESRYGSGLKCSLLKSADKRQDCEIQVNEMIGMMLESEIVGSFDVKRCKELPSEVAERCENRLAEAGVQGPVSDEELEMFREAIRGTSLALNKENEEGETPMSQPVYDSSKCAKLKTSGYKEYCESQVVYRIDQYKLDEIIMSDNSARCDELKNEDFKTMCKQFFGEESVAPETVEPATTTESPEEMTSQ